MISLEKKKLKLIAFHLITSRNPAARGKLAEKRVPVDELPGYSVKLLYSLGFSDEDVRRLKGGFLEAAEEELVKAREGGIDIFFKGEEYYPSLLEEIYDPPDFIYSLGDKEILKAEKLAVVGSRKAGSYGWSCLQQTLPDICRAGLTIVSGMAYGIDSMAHEITLREKGRTIGVNAGGLLRLYPAGNQALIRKIVENGCIISEFALDTVPRPFYFPIRNRIIAGISRAVLVVEAAMKSGSLITARLALEQNRDIYAFPGPINSPVSRGTNYLIQKGAKLITCAVDILEEFGIESAGERQPPGGPLTKKEKKILDLMPVNELKSIDYFAERLDCSISEIISLLMGMILKNIVIEEAGGYRRIR